MYLLKDKKYSKYALFIEECKLKNPTKYHIHHILPTHMGGTDDDSNLIKLSYKDHQTAHILLAECFPLNSSYYKSNMWSAARLNAWVENPNMSEIISEMIKGENNPFYGKTHSPETLEKTTHTLELYISKYGEVEGKVKFKEWKASCAPTEESMGKEKHKEWLEKTRTTLDNFIRRYGEVEGTKRYEEWKAKIARPGKTIIYKGVEYKSISEAARLLNTSRTNIRNWLTS